MGYRDEHRQLAAIMFTDIVGYTALMSENEASALRALKRSRRLVRRLTRRYKGRWLESVGDGNLISFASATDAVNCALAIQHNLERESNLNLRIGLNVGDVIEAGGHIYGDGVNVASRIHALAEPGGIVVSEPIYDAVRNKAGINVDRLGVREIKGLDHPIQVYALSGEVVDAPLLGAIDLPGGRRGALGLGIAALAVAVLIAAGVFTQYTDVRADNLSIAVLPFENLSDDASNSYFSRGISEELINGLSTVSGLRVVGRSSSFAYAGKAQDVREVGSNLNVAYVLEGSVRRSDDRVRISVALVDTENGFQLWANTYEAELDDIFGVQADISQSIVSALRLQLLPEELAEVGQVSTSNVEAYEEYLMARDILREANSREAYDDAIELLDSGLRRDPRFVEAEAAKCEALTGKYRQTRDSELIDPAVDTCNRALKMDPEAPQVNVALGHLYLTTGRPEFAEDAFDHALESDPGNVEALLGLAKALIDQGREDAADARYKRAVDLMPKNARIYQDYAASMANAGQYEKAERLIRQSIEIDPDNPRSYSHLGAILFYLGEFQEASDALIKASEIGDYDKAYNNLGTLLFFAGDYGQSVEMFRKAMELTPDDSRIVGYLADACRLAKDCADARKFYRKAVELTDERLSVKPDDAEEIALKGRYRLHLGDKDEARSLAERAMAIDPENNRVLLNTAIIWSQLGEYEKAKEQLDRLRASGYSEAIIDGHPDIVDAGMQKPR